MRRIFGVLSLVIVCATIVSAQDVIVEGVEISGVSDEKFSASLKDDLDKLIGRGFDVATADHFADRMQGELPEYVVAPRTMPGSEASKVRLIFVAAPISDEGGLGANINSRYPIDAVEIEGAPRSKVSDALYADMQKMVGERLNN